MYQSWRDFYLGFIKNHQTDNRTAQEKKKQGRKFSVTEQHKTLKRNDLCSATESLMNRTIDEIYTLKL